MAIVDPDRVLCYAWVMKVLVKAIVTGFGLSVGAYVFRKLSARYNSSPCSSSSRRVRHVTTGTPTV